MACLCELCIAARKWERNLPPSQGRARLVELVRSSKTCPGPLCDTMLASTAHVAPTTTIPLPCIFARLVVNLHIVRCRRRTTHFTSTITTLLLGVTDLVVVLRVTVWHRLTPSRVWPPITTPSPAIADALFVHPAGLRLQRKATNDACIVTIGITHLLAAVSALVGSWRTIVDIDVGVDVTAFLPALSPPTAYSITVVLRQRRCTRGCGRWRLEAGWSVVCRLCGVPLRRVSACGARVWVSSSDCPVLTAGRVNPDWVVSCIGGNYLHRRYLAARDRAN